MGIVHRSMNGKKPADVIARQAMLARLSVRLSQPQLAHEIGASRQWLQKVEAGEIVSPGLDKLERLAHATGTSLAFLLGESGGAELSRDELQGLARLAKLMPLGWMERLEGMLKAMSILPVNAQAEVWQQIDLIIQLKELQIKRESNGQE